MKCAECRYANKSGREDFVFCTYWTGERAKSGYKDAIDFIKNEVYKSDEPKEVALGWGYPKKPFKGVANSVVGGTVDEGLMWSNQICVSMEDKCSEFESRG